MKGYTFGVLFLLCLLVISPENSDAYSAGTGRFGDESKVGYSSMFFISPTKFNISKSEYIQRQKFILSS